MALPSLKVMSLTDAAASRVKDIIAKAERPIVGVRVGVKNGGCAGMSYTMEYAESVEPHGRGGRGQGREGPDRPRRPCCSSSAPRWTSRRPSSRLPVRVQQPEPDLGLRLRRIRGHSRRPRGGPRRPWTPRASRTCSRSSARSASGRCSAVMASMSGSDVRARGGGEIYLKVDETNRPQFEAAGSPPFAYEAKGGAMMSYWLMPEVADRRPCGGARWGRLGIEAAARAPRPPEGSSPRSPRG